MNKKTIIHVILFSVILCISGNTAFSQLKVKGDNGKVIIGTVPSEASQIYVEDFNNILSASIFGKGGYGSGAKLSFGDFGRMNFSSWNVFIGEYGSTDTDKLWLHGKYGFYLTYSIGVNVMYYDLFNDRFFHLETELITHGVRIPATKSSQQNVSIIKNSIGKINSINGITYQYKFFNNISDTTTTQGGSAKEIADQEFFNNLNEEMNNYAPQKNGFDAVQLKNVFPELVETDKDGNSYIDYTGLIPVLVEAIKEQSKIITAQSLKLKEMGLLAEDITTMSESSTDSNFTTKSSTSDTNTTTDTINSILANAFLYQNTPNPFNTTTEIKYFLPEGSTNAYIYIFNLQGNLLLTYNLSDNGFGSVIINGSSLNAGMYIYSLVVNGQEAETKRMILTK
ncbi:MAG: T9SS type A sorting domain-containing protein [Bacteroidales bacterium]|nr:T9SS type A sorting domain-containing protein [Bacteroidales bacterium]